MQSVLGGRTVFSKVNCSALSASVFLYWCFRFPHKSRMCGSNPPRFYFSFPASSHPRSSIAWRKEIQEEELTGVQARFATLQKPSLLLCCTSNQSDAWRLYIKISTDVYDNKPVDIKFFGYNLSIFMSVHKHWSMDWLLQLLISHGGHCWHGDRANRAIAS